MVRVQVEQGWLEGEKLEVVTGDGHYYSFKGIPYAAPPVGKLRFKKPQPPLSWKGIKDAKEHGDICVQFDIFTQQIVPGSEDCLYLNVYSPNIQPRSPLPVMFFIHGGGYKCGSGNVDNYGPDFLVQHDVVLVTINYRLEVLGFLCLDTPEVPGNAGMKDQVAALKWVQRNISKFGGDPKNVTIFGESAGGASTAYHALSPMSKGLFKRSISMSGVPFTDWSTAFEPRRRAFILGKQLGIDTSDPNELLEYLQSVPAEKLVNTNPCILTSEEITNNIAKMYHFTPVIEKRMGHEAFLTEHPKDILEQGRVNNTEFMLGYTNGEFLVGLRLLELGLLNLYNRYPEMVVPRKILINSDPSKILEVSDRIIKRYFNNEPITVDKMKELVKYGTESTFIYDIQHFVELLSKIDNRTVFLYKFCCSSEINMYGNQGQKYGLEGASHLDDLLYLFDAKKFNLKVDKTSSSYKMIQHTCALFTNFAKSGNPTPDGSVGATWPEYNNKDKNYLNISDTLTAKTRPDDGVLEFWTDLYKYAGVPF